MKIGDRVQTCEGFTGTIVRECIELGQHAWRVQWDLARQSDVGVYVVGATYFDSEIELIEQSAPEDSEPVETDWRDDYAKWKEKDRWK